MAFEVYSASCESRNEQDRQVHAFLHRETSKARAIMEAALEELVRVEAIEV